MTVLGIDIGGTRIKAGLVGADGAILVERAVRTPDTVDGFRAALGETLGLGAAQAAGIGCKGIVDAADTRIVALPGTLHFLEGHYLRDLMPPGIPVAADNDARAAMAGEWAWGAARGRRNAMLLTLGTGVGGAAVVEGQLLRGHGGVGGHLGHVTVEPDGETCICGSRGCLETVFSAHAIEGQALAAVHRGCASILTERFFERRGELTCRAVFEAAAEGDAVARQIVERATHRLGAAVAGLVHVFDPEIVILGGQIAEAGQVLLEPVARAVAWRTHGLLRRTVPVVRAEITSGVAGAAALAMRTGAGH